jgi:hypothetical protein
MTGQSKTLASRTVTGVIAGMVAATATATAVGFWLSYDGLHVFALRAGLHGPEAWAWPASVDLFILAGEAGVTISALRRHQDWAAWLYLAIGFAASVTANVLHVDPSGLFWIRYAVAAVPPVAAMLALAALLRQVYRLAEHAAPDPTASLSADRSANLSDDIPGTVSQTGSRTALETGTETTTQTGPAAINGPVRKALGGPVPDSDGGPVRKPASNRSGSRKPNRSATAEDAEREFGAEIAAGEVPSLYLIRSRLHVGNERAKVLRQHIARQALTT